MLFPIVLRALSSLRFEIPRKRRLVGEVESMGDARDAHAQWQSAAMSSPTLRMASVDEQMAGQKEKLAKSELLPKVAVVAQNNFNGPITFELPPVNKNLNIWYVGVGVSYLLIVPTFLRSFSYTIFFVTMTLYLEELMPFQHFFMGLTICGFIRNGLLSTMTESIYAFLLRYHIMDNLVSAHPYTPEMSLLTGIKLLYGVTCMGGCFFLLLLMLWHVSPVRSTLKHLPYWGKLGHEMRKELGR